MAMTTIPTFTTMMAMTKMMTTMIEMNDNDSKDNNEG